MPSVGAVCAGVGPEAWHFGGSNRRSLAEGQPSALGRRRRRGGSGCESQAFRWKACMHSAHKRITLGADVTVKEQSRVL